MEQEDKVKQDLEQKIKATIQTLDCIDPKETKIIYNNKHLLKYYQDSYYILTGDVFDVKTYQDKLKSESNR